MAQARKSRGFSTKGMKQPPLPRGLVPGRDPSSAWCFPQAWRAAILQRCLTSEAVPLAACFEHTADTEAVSGYWPQPPPFFLQGTRSPLLGVRRDSSRGVFGRANLLPACCDLLQIWATLEQNAVSNYMLLALEAPQSLSGLSSLPQFIIPRG